MEMRDQLFFFLHSDFQGIGERKEQRKEGEEDDDDVFFFTQTTVEFLGQDLLRVLN